MRKILLSAFAFAAMTSVAMAGPVKMTDAQMDAVTAGATNVSVVNQVAVAVAIDSGATAVALNEANVTQVAIGSSGGKKKFDRKQPKKRFQSFLHAVGELPASRPQRRCGRGTRERVEEERRAAMKAIQRHPVGPPTVGGTACSRSWGREAASALIPLLILGSVATAALAGPAALTDVDMDRITAANSGQQQHWLLADEQRMVEAMVDAVRARPTAAQDIRTQVSASVDAAGLRDAATAAARGAEAAASGLRAAEQGVRVPAKLGTGTAGVSESVTSVTSVTRSNGTVAKATTTVSASGTGRGGIAKTFTSVRLRN